MRPATLKMQESAGGVIFRMSEGKAEVALISVKGGAVWSLPKGIIDKGETPEATAVREVSEETGLKGNIAGLIGRISYWYFIKEENARCKKTVTFYLMKYESGSTDDHDSEVDKAAWFPIEEAVKNASYKGDRTILEKAQRMISGYGKDDS